MGKVIQLQEEERLRQGKNLLGFSGGVDSTALFFLLLERGIPFDIALVNYHQRAQAKEEESYAKELAHRYQKRCFTLSCPLGPSNFEHQARLERYRFFESLIHQEGYARLLLAHHLGDRLEWLLMRLAQGSSLATLLGFSSREIRLGYEIIRPLGEITKEALYDYLHQHQIRYFEDESNRDPKPLRNRFRPLSETLLKEHAQGLLQSFRFLQEEREILYGEDPRIRRDSLFYFPSQERETQNLHLIDLSLKALGYVMSQGERQELLKSGFCMVLKGKVAIDRSERGIFIAPFERVIIPKAQRERLRIAKIPPKVRPYCFMVGIDSLL